MSGRLLLVGSHPYDVDSLVAVGETARDRFGYDLCFASIAPLDVADAVHDDLEARGFTCHRRPLLRFPKDRRNPFARARVWRDANLGVVDHVVDEIRPTAVLATVNPPPGIFLEELARRGVPSVLLQLFFWGDRSFQRDWRREDRRIQEAALTPSRRRRAAVERFAATRYGMPPQVAWDVHHATVAVEGPAMARQLRGDGVDHVVSTGNPVLDEVHARAGDLDAARRRTEAALGLSPTDVVVTHFRSHEDRMLTLDAATRARSQAEVIRSVRAAAPGARMVVKIHPKEGPAERDLIASIDPDVLIADSTVDTLDLIGASAVVVGTFSTTLLHSVALDRPTVAALLWPGLEYWRRATAWSGVERCADAAQLTEAVRRNLDDADHRAEWSRRRAEFRADQFVLDGHGTDNVAALVHRLVTGSAP